MQQARPLSQPEAKLYPAGSFGACLRASWQIYSVRAESIAAANDVQILDVR